jgi:Zn-dependent peptidase ImmA (M78 family)/DNA-binding XRE family transcriptional regulator
MKPGTLGFIGARLREAREARGLTAIALSDLIGVTRQAISQYENEAQSPRPEIMERITRTLQLPVAYFRFPLDVTMGTIFYRSISAATKSARSRAEKRYLWVRIIDSYLREFIDFPKLNFPSFNLPSDPRSLSPEDIEDLAVQARQFWNFSNGPINNMVSLLESNGAIVIRDELGADTLDAFSDVLPLTEYPQYVVLGADKNISVRSRFDSAHEMAHKILHGNIDKSFLSRKADHHLIESQAHRFAAAFLLPADSFGNEFYSVDLDVLKNLKLKWRVSIAMMIKRAEDLNFISTDQSRRLWIKLSRMGWKTKEPYDDTIEIECPRLLRQAFEMLINENIQTREEILSHIPLAQNDIEKLASLDPGYLTEPRKESLSGVISLIPRQSREPHAVSGKASTNDNQATIIQFPHKNEKN